MLHAYGVYKPRMKPGAPTPAGVTPEAVPAHPRPSHRLSEGAAARLPPAFCRPGLKRRYHARKPHRAILGSGELCDGPPPPHQNTRSIIQSALPTRCDWSVAVWPGDKVLVRGWAWTTRHFMFREEMGEDLDSVESREGLINGSHSLR